MNKNKNLLRRRESSPERAFLLEALASVSGRTFFVPLIFSSVIFSTGFLFPNETYFGVSVHLLDASVLITSILVLLVFSTFVARSNNRWINLFFWSATGSLSALTPTISLLLLTGQVSQNIISQFPIGVIAYSFLTAVTSIAVAGISLSRSRLHSLKRNRALLQEIRHELETQIQIMRGEIKQGVQNELEKAISSLKEQRNPKELSQSLLTAIDDVIRPLSHRLAGFGSIRRMPKNQGSLLYAPPLKSGVSLARLAAPEIYGLLFAVFILPASFYVDGLTGLASAVSLLFFELALLVIIERGVLNLFMPRVAGMIVMATGSGIVGLLYPLIAKSSEFGVSAGFVTTSFAVTGLMSLVSKRIDDLRDLELVNQEMQAVVSVLRQEAWVTKNNLAKAIHGSVQSKFLAVALRIGSTKKISSQELMIARKELESSIREVESSVYSNPSGFHDQFLLIASVWDGVAKLHLKESGETIKRLDDFPVARTCVLEVISEAVANAAKHSKAPLMDIELQENGLDQIVVSVWSAGKLATRAGRSGYGSKLLDEVTSGWSLTNLKGRVYLRAVIQLSK